MSSEVAAAAPMTAKELLELPDDAHRYDLVRGELRRMTPAGYRHGRLAALITHRLRSHVEEHRSGEVLAAETGFMIEHDPDTVLAPDVAFVAADRVPDQEGDTGFADLAPDLVVEVVSPSDRASEVTEKALLWLDAGVRLVWVVDPRQRLVTVYRPDDTVQLVRHGDELGGANVLPGFRLSLGDLFA